VVGAAGAGKSSFVQAGVIPRLREQERWLVLLLRPGNRPFLNLADRLRRREVRSSGRRPSQETDPSSSSTSLSLDEGFPEELESTLFESPARLSLILRSLAD